MNCLRNIIEELRSFSVDAYDPVQYRDAARQLAEGDLTLPARIGYPPRADYDCELILNFDAVYDSGAMLMQEEAFAVTSKADFTVPWQCIEAAFFQEYAHTCLDKSCIL